MFKVIIDSYGEIEIGVDYGINMAILTIHEPDGNKVTFYLDRNELKGLIGVLDIVDRNIDW